MVDTFKDAEIKMGLKSSSVKSKSMALSKSIRVAYGIAYVHLSDFVLQILASHLNISIFVWSYHKDVVNSKIYHFGNVADPLDRQESVHKIYLIGFLPNHTLAEN